MLLTVDAGREIDRVRVATVRVAAVRQNRAPSPLRRSAVPIDSVRALRRKTLNLQARRDALLEEARWGLRTHALLLWQIETQYAAIQAIHRKCPTRRAML